MNESFENLFNSLTEEQKTQLSIAYEESFDENNLLDHNIVKQQHLKWLNKYEL